MMKSNKISLILGKVRNNHTKASPRLLGLQLHHTSHPSSYSRYLNGKKDVRSPLVDFVLNTLSAPSWSHSLTNFNPQIFLKHMKYLLIALLVILTYGIASEDDYQYQLMRNVDVHQQ